MWAAGGEQKLRVTSLAGREINTLPGESEVKGTRWNTASGVSCLRVYDDTVPQVQLQLSHTHTGLDSTVLATGISPSRFSALRLRILVLLSSVSHSRFCLAVSRRGGSPIAATS